MIPLFLFTLISWISAWGFAFIGCNIIPSLPCGIDIFNNSIIQPKIQIPTFIVPITEIITQSMAFYGMTQNKNNITKIAYIIQGIAFPLWTIAFLGLKSKPLSLLLAIITLICTIIMIIFSNIDNSLLWFGPIILHKIYDVYWTWFAEITF